MITTGPPQSAHLVGQALRRRGVAWIADLRDGWTFDPPRPPWPNAVLAGLDALARAVGPAERGPRGRRDRADRAGPARASRSRRLGRDQRLRSRRHAGARRRRACSSPTGSRLSTPARLIASGDSARTLLEGALELRQPPAREPSTRSRSCPAAAGQRLGRAGPAARGSGGYAAVWPAGGRPLPIGERALGPPARGRCAGGRWRPGCPAARPPAWPRAKRSYLPPSRPCSCSAKTTEAAAYPGPRRGGRGRLRDDPGSVADALERLIDSPPVRPARSRPTPGRSSPSATSCSMRRKPASARALLL